MSLEHFIVSGLTNLLSFSSAIEVPPEPSASLDSGVFETLTVPSDGDIASAARAVAGEYDVRPFEYVPLLESEEEYFARLVTDGKEFLKAVDHLQNLLDNRSLGADMANQAASESRDTLNVLYNNLEVQEARLQETLGLIARGELTPEHAKINLLKLESDISYTARLIEEKVSTSV